MNALKQLYEWCVTQELHSLTAAPFSRLARDARDTKVYRTGAREWIVHNDGFCRTFKFPWTGEVPDLSRSEGVTGWRRVKDLIYVHTSGRRNTRIALSLNPAPRLFLESSSSEIRFHELGTGRVRFHVKDFRPCRVVLAGASPNLPVWVSFNGNRHLSGRRERTPEDGIPAGSHGHHHSPLRCLAGNAKPSRRCFRFRRRCWRVSCSPAS